MAVASAHDKEGYDALCLTGVLQLTQADWAIVIGD